MDGVRFNEIVLLFRPKFRVCPAVKSYHLTVSAPNAPITRDQSPQQLSTLQNRSANFIRRTKLRRERLTPLSHAQGCRPPSRRLPSVPSASSLLSQPHFNGQQQELRPDVRACLAARSSSQLLEPTPKRRCLPRKRPRRRSSCWADLVIT